MLVVLRFTVTDEPSFLDAAQEALRVLAERPGYLRGDVCRAYDEPTVWCLAMQWETVGAYRRALGAYDVKMHATPLLASALPEASAFEPLLGAGPGGPVTQTESDRASAASPTPSRLPSRP